MTQLLLWWLECLPHCWQSLSIQWRGQQAVLHSAGWHAGRVLCSQATLPDKLSRLSRRSCADAISLLYDCGETQLSLARQWVPPLALDSDLLALGQKLQQRTGQTWLHGLVDLGRALSY